eukprot:TRINITY_DN27568_c0_g1_i2.p2 TRINITY_DN27568_c0_g1~~TRINITY_DN27568_c0_g1_i2.p2  ORF type:complete len:223 (+),score=46.19 TRINITY_DN27568_c0_g1_i2:81-671(+)
MTPSLSAGLLAHTNDEEPKSLRVPRPAAKMQASGASRGGLFGIVETSCEAGACSLSSPSSAKKSSAALRPPAAVPSTAMVDCCSDVTHETILVEDIDRMMMRCMTSERPAALLQASNEMLDECIRMLGEHVLTDEKRSEKIRRLLAITDELREYNARLIRRGPYFLPSKDATCSDCFAPLVRSLKDMFGAKKVRAR